MSGNIVGSWTTNQQSPDGGWSVIAETVRGASHIRSGLPNQDAVDVWQPDRPAASVALCVADGHGSQRSFRSDRGARFAVEVGLEVGAEFLQGTWDGLPLSEIRRQAEERLPQAVSSRWRAKVDEDCDREPLPEGTPDAYLAYGSTVLVVLVSSTLFVYAQLGDGEILVVDATGRSRRPLSGDSRLIGNETTSLASPKPWREFRVAIEPAAVARPALVLVTTDGYPNSFKDDAGFLQAGADILALLRSDGPDAIKRDLPVWLRESSDEGSGDDVTVALLFETGRLGASGPADAVEG
jgi:hypothetical protein